VDSRTIALVKESYTHIGGRTIELADRFFNNLFTRQTSVRGFFPPDVTEQKQQLPSVVQTILDNGDRLETLEPRLRTIGRRYAEQGVLPTHYSAVARTFVDTVREMSGIGWQARYTRAWTSLLDALTNAIITASIVKPERVAAPRPQRTAATTPAAAKPASTKPAPAKKASSTKAKTAKKPTGGKSKRAA
jgi:hemoglobin-like flavoprotein